MVLFPGIFAPIGGPPSSYALSMRPWLIVIFFLLLAVAVARIVVVDIIGGLFLVMASGIGYYAVKTDMDAAWMLCLAVVLFLNSLFDAFIIAVRALRAGSSMLGSKLPWYVNVIHSLLFLGPVLEMVGSCLCWKIYREHLSSLGLRDDMGLGSRGVGYGTSQRVSAVAGGQGAAASVTGGRRGSAQFEAFGGPPHRLCD
mmetsp:Transcript_72103/g.181790  ORF Transcript_72103/g.181790 Transcript_72103/m.181790 type:complete len:199 (-) Transcript_72103:116-712(-)